MKVCGVFERLNIVSSNLLTVMNRLFTTVMLVALLFACHKMPEGKNIEGIRFERQVN